MIPHHVECFFITADRACASDTNNTNAIANTTPRTMSEMTGDINNDLSANVVLYYLASFHISFMQAERPICHLWVPNQTALSHKRCWNYQEMCLVQYFSISQNPPSILIELHASVSWLRSQPSLIQSAGLCEVLRCFIVHFLLENTVNFKPSKT